MKSFAKALSVLKQGGVIAHATETCYGFACNVMSKKALERLYKLKKMAKNKPISLFVQDLKTAKKYGFFNKNAIVLAKKYWPGPLTIIVRRKNSLPSFVNPGHKTVGFRVPGHKLSLKLARAYGKPLTTTSANISGMPSPYSVSATKKQFAAEKLKPDFYINSGRLKQNPPSTIIDLSEKKAKIIRQGALKLSSPT